MAKQSFMPSDDDGKTFWLANFAVKLPLYAAKYNIISADITDMTDSDAYWSFWYVYRQLSAEYQSKLTAFKNELRSGVKPGSTPSVLPAAPVIGTVPAVVSPGIFVRATAIGNRIKAHNNYTVADGQDMGLEGAETELDLVNVKPNIVAKLVAGVPRILWKKQGYDGLEIHVSRNGAPYIFLAHDTFPDYDDTAPLPAAGQSALWKYKAIYTYKDERVGQWSDEVSVTVMG